MAEPRVDAGGGWPAIRYVLRRGREAGGLLALYRRLRSRNACKTCALGMGGARGGMVNEAGRFPEVCKKSIQAQAGDMGRVIPESFFRDTPLAALEALTSGEAEALGRLAFPVMAGPGDDRFRRISWDDALDLAGAALRESPPEETFFYASGRSSNEAAFLLQLVARAYGTANIHNCSYYCHAASGVALGRIYGSGTASIVLEDLDRTDLVLLAGCNPASNHPRLISRLVELRRRGGRVIVVNPLRELGLERFRLPSDPRSLLFGSTIADLYLQPHVGGDVPLFRALLKGLVESGATDDGFVENATTGFVDAAADVTTASWDDLVAESGVPRESLDAAVRMIAAAPRGVVAWAMGLTHHEHGVDNIHALGNVALARGWLGKPGAGLLPIRGHSNVQGVGSVGVSPQVKEEFARKLEELYGITVPRGGGQDTFASMEAAHDGRIRAAVLLGGNLWGSNPDQAWASRALRRIPFSLSLTTKLNPGHFHGRGRTAVLVPVLARDEESQSTTQESMFNFVRVSEGGLPSVAGELRSEVDIVASLAERILPDAGFTWGDLRSHAHLREAIARVVPGYEPLAGLDGGGPEFQIPGRTFHAPRFPTDDGRARFVVPREPAFRPADGDFRLMTLRSEGQFNTVVYEEEDLYRGNTRRDVVMMAAADATRLGVAEGDPVTVETEAGRMEVRAAIAPIRAGSLAMYYPEANALVPGRLDPESRTPAFKSVRARLYSKRGV